MIRVIVRLVRQDNLIPLSHQTVLFYLLVWTVLVDLIFIGCDDWRLLSALSNQFHFILLKLLRRGVTRTLGRRSKRGSLIYKDITHILFGLLLNLS